MLPPERSLLPPNKTNQRKIPSSTPLGKTYPRLIETIDRSSKCVSGQQKKIRGVAQEQHNMLGKICNFNILLVSPIRITNIQNNPYVDAPSLCNRRSNLHPYEHPFIEWAFSIYDFGFSHQRD